MGNGLSIRDAALDLGLAFRRGAEQEQRKAFPAALSISALGAL